MKRKFTLPALLLSQALTPSSHAVIKPTSYDMGDFDFRSSMSLSGRALTTNNQSYRIELNLSQGSFIGQRSDNSEQVIFEFLGTANFYKDGEDRPSVIGLPFEDAGDVVFQLAESSDGKKSYVGSHCNSSVTGCIDMDKEKGEQLLLVHDTIQDLWYLSVRAPMDDSKDTMMEFSNVELKKNNAADE